ncbi:MAG: hypothetical protein VX899_17365 [Myxococcota bacterium]|nr:hypothetical protein [Myxococcota bacterium]
MAKSERHKQKALEKKKKKAAARKQARKRQVVAARQAANADLDVAAQWDWAECFASETWHERGAKVRTIAVKRHHTEARTAVFFDVDLATGEVTRVDILKGAHPGEVQNEVIRISTDSPLQVVDPGVILAILEAAQRRAQDTGVTHHRKLEQGLQIFGDLDADPVQILTGTEADPGQDPEPQPTGLWDRIKSGLGM